MSLLYGQTATRLRAPLGTDKYGNPSTTRDWSAAVSTPLAGVNVQPDGVNSSSEDQGDRMPVITGWKLYSARGVDIDLLATDRVLWDGLTLEVDGEVGRYYLAGAVHHIEARLRRVTG